MNRILIVEDSMESYEIAKRALGTTLQIEWAKNVNEALRALDSRPFDLVLLDISLPDGDGFHLCSLMQTHQDLKGVAVIFLTARNSVADKVMGFSVGGDDFIGKPFDPVELKARVHAKLRRRERDRIRDQVLQVGAIEINKNMHAASFQARNGETVDLDLTPIEFKILLFLAQKADHVHSRDEVLNAVWGENVHVYSRSVDTHVSKLRKKMGETAGYLQSVHGAGYRFSVDGCYEESRHAVALMERSLSRGEVI